MNKTASIQLPRDRSCAAVARRFLERRLRGPLGTETLEDAKLIATELVDNAYFHGQGKIKLRLERGDDRVRLEVIDEGRGAAVKVRPRGGSDFGGYGLELVQRLSAAWGAFEGTTHVWVELPVR